MNGIVSSWGRILGGYAPALSIEITRECPLRCPGCYAFCRKIWFSLYTPQMGESSAEKLRPEDRLDVVATLLALRQRHAKVEMPKAMIEGYAVPPSSPDDCVFSRVTQSVSADLETRITPCQFGGRPDCANCGCIASAGLAALGRYHLAGPLRVDHVFSASFAVGSAVRSVRQRLTRRAGAVAPPAPSRAV